MISVSAIVSGNKTRRHVLFLLVLAGLMALGLWLLHIEGFRFADMRLVAVNCGFFILYLYSGRWLCSRWYLQGKIIAFAFYVLLTIMVLALVDFLLLKYVFNHPFVGFIELLYGSSPFFLVALGVGHIAETGEAYSDAKRVAGSAG